MEFFRFFVAGSLTDICMVDLGKQAGLFRHGRRKKIFGSNTGCLLQGSLTFSQVPIPDLQKTLAVCGYLHSKAI
jgi:hypothetical protein